jgi:rhodanese-related sulfurtransferase
MPITKGFRTLVDEATAQITTYTVADVLARLNAPVASGQLAVQLVDIRDPRELEREGTAPGCVHAPRGMLEFWVDPASPYFKPVFGDDSKEFVLFCGAGWRSALATKALQDMGMTNVAHIDGGFSAWKTQAAPIQTLAEHHEAARQAKAAAPVAKT